MGVKCPRCESEFQADDHNNDVKCQECGLLIETCHDDSYEYFDGEYMQYCYVFNDIPASCYKACENINLESCVGVCKVDSENQQEALKCQ